MDALRSRVRGREVRRIVPLVAMLLWLGACIPGSDGKFHACMTSATGAIRLVDYDTVQTCNTGEVAVAWNQAGPQGPAGPPGPAGGRSRLGGGVRFVDKLDTTGYLGPVDDIAIAQAAADAAFTSGAAGSVSAFKAERQAGGATLTFTLVKNGTDTAISCAVAGAASSCTDADTVAVAASDTLVVRVTQPGSTFARYVRWSAFLAAS